MADQPRGHTWKSRIAGLLAGAGLTVLTISLLMMYVGRVLVREDTFADRVSASLQDPRVGEFVALKMTDAVIAQKPDLTALRPILVVVTRGVVTSKPFGALVRPAVRQAHRAVTSSTTENILLALPDARVLIHEALKNVGAGAADRLPPRLQPVLQSRPGAAWRGAARAGLGIAGALRPFGRLGLVAAILVLAAAVVLSPHKRSALLTAGVGIATVGAVLALTVPAGRVLVSSVIADHAASDAAAGLWDAFFGPLRIAGIVVALVGATVALIAQPGDSVDPAALRDRIWTFVTQRRQNPWAEAGRLLGLGIAGLAAFLAPSAAGTVVVVAAGAALLLLSLAEVRRLVQPYLPTTMGGGAAGETRVATPVLVGVRVVALLALGVGAAAVLLRLRPPQAVAATESDACNGAVELCARRFNRVVFPAAHNAMGAATNPTWLFPNQDLDIGPLLDRGVRAFLLDPYRGNAMGDRVRTDFDAVPHANRKIAEVIGNAAWQAGMRVRERLTGAPGASAGYFCHGFCELGAIPMVPTLRTFVEFLVLHPGEVVIISFEDYAPPADIAAAFEESGLIDFVYRGPLGPTWPTLGEMIASGGRVVVLGDTDVGDVPWYHHSMGGLVTETPYTFHTPQEFNCRPNRGTPTGELFLINHWIETTPTPRPSNAEIVNQRDVLVRRARQCQRERHMLPTMLAVDFAGIGDVVGAARELNGLPPVEAVHTQQ